MLHYHILQGRNNTSTPSLLVMLLNMILINIIVIFVKNKTQCIGSTTMQIVIIGAYTFDCHARLGVAIFIQTHQPTQNPLNLKKSWPNPIKYLG